MDIIRVYTDGSCLNNGKKNEIEGIGIYFVKNDPRNTSKRISGKQTNNTAELKAVIEVFHILKKDLHENKKIIIYSDSEYTIKCSGSFGEDSQKLQCKKKRGQGFIPNHELVKEIYEYFQKYPNVSIEYIRGHTNLLDQHSFGNNEADRLARLATDINL